MPTVTRVQLDMIKEKSRALGEYGRSCGGGRTINNQTKVNAWLSQHTLRIQPWSAHNKAGVVVCTCNPRSGKAEIGRYLKLIGQSA